MKKEIIEISRGDGGIDKIVKIEDDPSFDLNANATDFGAFYRFAQAVLNAPQIFFCGNGQVVSVEFFIKDDKWICKARNKGNNLEPKAVRTSESTGTETNKEETNKGKTGIQKT